MARQSATTPQPKCRKLAFSHWASFFFSFRFFLSIANSRVHTACLDCVERGIRYFWVFRHDSTRCVFAVVRHVWRVFGISSCDVLYSRRIQRDWQLRSYGCVPSYYFILCLPCLDVRESNVAFDAAALGSILFLLSSGFASICHRTGVWTSQPSPSR